MYRYFESLFTNNSLFLLKGMNYAFLQQNREGVAGGKILLKQPVSKYKMAGSEDGALLKKLRTIGQTASYRPSGTVHVWNTELNAL